LAQDEAKTVTVTIAEAARMLKVSERTVYRHIKSGKIECVTLSDSRSIPKVKISVGTPDFVVRMSDNLPKQNLETLSMPSQEITTLRAELQSRDAQIESLIAGHREMNQTIQQLNQQIYELARLVLASETEKNEKKAGMWRQWLGKWKPAAQEKQKS
jgi:excisionase family DNA binding protein